MTEREAIFEIDRLDQICRAAGWQLRFAEAIGGGYAGMTYPDRKLILIAKGGCSFVQLLARVEHEVDHAMRSAIGRGHAQRRTADETFGLICAGAIRVR